MAMVPTMKPAPSAASSHVNILRCDAESVWATTGAPSVASKSALQRDFTRPFQIRQKHFFGQPPERSVFDDRIELVVDRHAEWIEVRRSDADPASVDHTRLGVHHFALPFPDAHAVGEQAPVESPRHERHPRMIV